MKECYMCGGKFEDELTVCPICGTPEKVKTGLKLASNEDAGLKDENTAGEEIAATVALGEGFYDRSMYQNTQEEEKEISYAMEEPYVQNLERKKTEREYYNSVDMRKYKNQVQVGYIILYVSAVFSLVMDFMLPTDSITKLAGFISIVILLTPTLIAQFTRSRIAAVINVAIFAINFILSLTSGYSSRGSFLGLLAAIYMAVGIFNFKSHWEFYKNK